MSEPMEQQNQAVEIHPTLVAIFRANPRLAVCFKQVTEHPAARELLNQRSCVELMCALVLVKPGHWLDASKGLPLIPDHELTHVWSLIREAAHRLPVGSRKHHLWSFAAEAYVQTSGETIPRRGWLMRRDPLEFVILYFAFGRAFADLMPPRRRIVERP